MDIYIVDQTVNNKLDVDINDLVAALQEQVSRDFAPLWGIDATLHATQDDPSSGSYTIILLDSCENSNDLGFHVDTNNTPTAKCGVGDAQKYNVAPSSVISHELLEMLADPLCTRMVTVPNDPRQFLVEVCDPVSENYYQIGNITVSSFVTPRYFGYTNMGHYDQLGLLNAGIPTLGYGGMVMWFDGQKWSNTFARRVNNDLPWRINHKGRSHHRAHHKAG